MPARLGAFLLFGQHALEPGAQAVRDRRTGGDAADCVFEVAAQVTELVDGHRGGRVGGLVWHRNSLTASGWLGWTVHPGGGRVALWLS